MFCVSIQRRRLFVMGRSSSRNQQRKGKMRHLQRNQKQNNWQSLWKAKKRIRTKRKKRRKRKNPVCYHLMTKKMRRDDFCYTTVYILQVNFKYDNTFFNCVNKWIWCDTDRSHKNIIRNLITLLQACVCMLCVCVSKRENFLYMYVSYCK